MNAQHSQVARNYFDLFSITPQFDIDVSKLRNDFRLLQKKFHPDNFIHASEREKIAAIKQSSLLNDAFEILTNPVKRAAYLVELAGVDIHKDRFIEPDILMQQMLLREELEEILDQAEISETELEQFSNKIENDFKLACQKFSNLYLSWQSGKVDLQQLKQALSIILFYDKLKHQVDKAQELFE